MSNEFITTDAGLIYDEIITQLEAGVSEPLYPGDERRLFGEALVPLFVAMYNAMNDAARQKMLRYARGEVLDALGERVGVERLAPTEATTLLAFWLESPITENVIIQKGTRVTSDNERYFITAKTAVIEAGQIFVEVEAVSEGVGSKYNNIPAGAIDTIVDLIPYVDAVENCDTTAGGSDEETDDNLRERIRVAPSKLSTAGPVNGYRYWAMSADSSIADVRVKSTQETITRMLPVHEFYAYKGGSDLIAESLVVYEGENNDSPATAGIDYEATYEDDLLTIELLPNGSLLDRNDHLLKISIDKTNDGVVKIVPICEGGELPDDAIIEKVLTACSASDVRPLTDKVVVEKPKVHEYDIALTYYTDAASESACIHTVEGEGGAIDQFIAWQAGALGRHINPDKLRALILAPTGDATVGATRVVITSPEFTELNDTTIAHFSGNLTIKHEVGG